MSLEEELIDALKQCLNFITNCERALDDTYTCGDAARKVLEKVDSVENKMRKELLRQKEDLNYIIRTRNDKKLEYICSTMIDRIDNVLEEGVE